MSDPSDLDIERPDQLVGWLRSKGCITPDETPAVRVLQGGVSNRTVHVRRPNGTAWVLKQALPRLRVPTEWRCSPERVHREALAMRWMEHHLPPGAVPRFVFEDHHHHVIAMEAVPDPHDNWKGLLLQGRLDPRHVTGAARLMGLLHCEALRDSDSVRDAFADTTFFEILRLEPFYDFTSRRVPEAATALGALIRETRARRVALVHGDFSPKNLLIRDEATILIDHEVVHWGDPMFDAGFALAHLLSKAHHLPPYREVLGAAASLFWREYRTVAGSDLAGPEAEARAARHTLACLLARAAGRSQVDYLPEAGKARQRHVASRLLMASPTPGTIASVIESFLDGISG